MSDPASAGFAYVRGVSVWGSLEGELRGRFWFNYFGRSSLSPFAMPRFGGSIGWRRDRSGQFLTGPVMSFDRLKRLERLLGHKLKPSRTDLFVAKLKTAPLNETKLYPRP